MINPSLCNLPFITGAFTNRIRVLYNKCYNPETGPKLDLQCFPNKIKFVETLHVNTKRNSGKRCRKAHKECTHTYRVCLQFMLTSIIFTCCNDLMNVKSKQYESSNLKIMIVIKVHYFWMSQIELTFKGYWTQIIKYSSYEILEVKHIWHMCIMNYIPQLIDKLISLFITIWSCTLSSVVHSFV